MSILVTALIKGEKDMNYKIIDKESFDVIGKETRITMKGGKNFELVPKFWNDCMEDGSYEWIQSKAGKLGVLGVCKDVTRRIFSEWMPSAGYQHACAPELEVYPEGDTSSPDYRCEVWIPIK